uniref:Uncharacterized protein n=1 Tax=Meloidogyne incognita TaxID=6306 RepID=A0A914MU32_MELIC
MNFKPKIPEYVKTNRFIIKIFQIFCGLIVHSSIGCLKWEGLCFKEDRNNIVAMINFCIILLNTSLYVLNFLKVNTVKFEKYSIIICNISLVVAIGFRQWYVIKIYKSAVSIYDPITIIFGIIIFGISALYSTSYNLSDLLFFVFNVNLIFVIINIAIVVINYFNGAYYKFERIYSIVGMVLSNICFLFMICFIIANHDIHRHSTVHDISLFITSTFVTILLALLTFGSYWIQATTNKHCQTKIGNFRYLIKIYRSLFTITDSTTMFICFIIILFIWEYLLLTNKELNSNEERNYNDNDGKKNERARLKLLQIIIGYSTCALLDGGHSFLNDEHNGFANSLNFGIFIINVVVLFFLNLLNAIINRLERLCSIIGVILFINAFGIMIWYLIEYEVGRNYVIGATV